MAANKKGKVIVTGASGGTGRSIVAVFREAGYEVDCRPLDCKLLSIALTSL
jgi:NAD(P)-dependent dehydrogenase (short-subunit alcohol dehydrogenase family)